MDSNPVATLRSALQNLIDGAQFNYDAGETRKLIGQANVVLRQTLPAVAHQPAVGIFKYDPQAKGFVQVDEDQALDSQGNLRKGYQYLAPC